MVNLKGISKTALGFALIGGGVEGLMLRPLVSFAVPDAGPPPPDTAADADADAAVAAAAAAAPPAGPADGADPTTPAAVAAGGLSPRTRATATSLPPEGKGKGKGKKDLDPTLVGFVMFMLICVVVWVVLLCNAFSDRFNAGAVWRFFAWGLFISLYLFGILQRFDALSKEDLCCINLHSWHNVVAMSCVVVVHSVICVAIFSRNTIPYGIKTKYVGLGNGNNVYIVPYWWGLAVSLVLSVGAAFVVGSYYKALYDAMPMFKEVTIKLSAAEGKFGLKFPSELEVASVVPNSPAAEAGVQNGWVITKVGDAAVSSINTFRTEMRKLLKTDADHKARATGHKQVKFTFKVKGDEPKDVPLSAVKGKFGLEFEKENLVLCAGLEAARAGVKPKWILIKIGNKQVSSKAELTEAFGGLQKGNPIDFTFNVKIDESDKPEPWEVVQVVMTGKPQLLGIVVLCFVVLCFVIVLVLIGSLPTSTGGYHID